MIIDASDLIAGRLATVVTKKALLGEQIDIVNSEKAVITGTRDSIYARFKAKYDRGIPLKGPYVHRSADRLLRRIIRGMLPYKQARGSEALARVMCWRGVPEKFQNQKLETVSEAKIDKLPNLQFVTVGDIAKHLGGKSE